MNKLLSLRASMILRKGFHSMSLIALFCCLNMPAARAMPPENSILRASSPTLVDILGRARKSVGEFWTQFGSVSCVERVDQQKLGKKGNVEYAQKSIFDYLVLLDADKDELSVEESRLQQDKKGKEKNIPLLITNGIPTLLLVFHPYYDGDFVYKLEGDETEGGHRLSRIAFQHLPGTRSTTALRLRGKDYPLDIQGKAWIDPETGAIERIVAGLSGPMDEVNLKVLEMEVRYDAHEFPAGKGVYWLPSIATINIQTEYQHWRNVHQYSNYKRFSVNAEDKVSRPSPDSGERKQP